MGEINRLEYRLTVPVGVPKEIAVYTTSYAGGGKSASISNIYSENYADTSGSLSLSAGPSKVEEKRGKKEASREVESNSLYKDNKSTLEFRIVVYERKTITISLRSVEQGYNFIDGFLAESAQLVERPKYENQVGYEITRPDGKSATFWGDRDTVQGKRDRYIKDYVRKIEPYL